jgi:peptidyl-prolyl cis-trans isomerase SurA
LLWALSATLLIGSCKTSAPPQPQKAEAPVLLQLGNRTFSTDEFFQSYTKNRFSADSSKALSASEYFELYTNMKLKVLAAQQEGRDTTADFQEEIASYKEQLAKNYLVDKNLVEEMATEAYGRLKEEVHASHILIALPPDPSPADTLSAHRAAVAMRGRLLEGADFAEMAEKFSKDPTAPANRGDLGYFTAFQTLYPFETAAYKLPAGEISHPVRTTSGYHLIKVHHRRPSRGKLRVAHIMTRTNPNPPEADKAAIKKRIDEAYARLLSGEAWEKVVEAYSDDFQSRKSGGMLPLFGTGDNVPGFEEAAFALEAPGSYSKPVQTPYGWHIIRLVERKNLDSYNIVAPALRQKVLTDSRGRIMEKNLANRLRSQYTVKEYPEVLTQVSRLADSTLVTGRWTYPEPLPNTLAGKILFSVEKQTFSARDFLDYIKTHQDRRTTAAGLARPGQDRPGMAVSASGKSSPTAIVNRLYNDFLDERLITYQRDNLEARNPEYRALINELREGVLLSQVMEKNVWERSLADSVGQRRLYEQNLANYRYPERALATVVVAADTAVLREVRQALSQTPYPLQRKGEELLFEEGKSEVLPRMREKLFEVMAIMLRNPAYTIEVSAHRTGTEPDSVSAARLRNVVRYLTSNNISLTRIMEKDHGSFRPVPEADRNRRISFQFFSRSRQDVEKAINARLEDRPEGAVRIAEGYFTRDNEYLSPARWEAGEQVYNRTGEVVWVQINTIEPSRPKTFAEARGSVINDYQKVLEKQWLDSLRARYPVKVNEQELEKLIR